MSSEQENLIIEGNRLVGVVEDTGEDLIIPEGVEIICENAAFENHASAIVLPQSLRRIESDAFSRMSELLEPVHIPAGVEYIAFDAFGDPPATTFTVDPDNRHYYAEDGVLHEIKEPEPDLYDPDLEVLDIMDPADRKRIEDWSIVSFGRYPQTEEGTDLTPIEWIVLSATEKSALLISRYALDSVPFDADYWCDSKLRAWLDGEFCDTAFTGEEAAMIIPAGKTGDTTDGLDGERAYALSVREAELYFRNERTMRTDYSEGLFWYEDAADRLCIATPYAVARGIDVYDETDLRPGSPCADWWLREYAPRHGSSTFMVSGGSGNICLVSPWINGVAARPVLRINLEN